MPCPQMKRLLQPLVLLPLPLGLVWGWLFSEEPLVAVCGWARLLRPLPLVSGLAVLVVVSMGPELGMSVLVVMSICPVFPLAVSANSSP